MGELIFPVEFESVLGITDRIPPIKPVIRSIEVFTPNLVRNEGTGWEVDLESN